MVLTKDSCCSGNVGTIVCSEASLLWLLKTPLPKEFRLCGLQDRTYMQFLEAAAMKLPVLPNEMNSIAHNIGLQSVARLKICQMRGLAA